MNKLIRRTATALAVATLTTGALAATAQAAPADGDPALTDVYIWATDVQLREDTNTSSNVLAVRSQHWLDAVCQKQGQTVTDPGVGTNNWWTAVQEFAGSDIAWVSNLYLQGGEKIEGVPDC